MLELNPFLWQELTRQRQELLWYEARTMQDLRMNRGHKPPRLSLREALASLIIQIGLRLQGAQGPWRCVPASESSLKASYNPGCGSHRRAVL